MSNLSVYAGNTGRVVRQDPAAAMKVIFVILLTILLIYAVFKFLKGFGKATELLSDFGPSTETEKREVIAKPSYQEGIKWLNGNLGAVTMGATKKYKNVDDYLYKHGSSWDVVSKAAEAIWKAKFPGYISETEVYNAIASMPTRTAVSFLAANFNAKYSKLWNGAELQVWLPKYLKLPEMETLTELISKKPKV